MSFRLLAIIVIILSFVSVLPKRRKEHYHRYLLSDYRPQHNRKTQMDYQRHRPPVDDIEETSLKHISKTRGPLITMDNTDKKIYLEELIVRIYKNFHFYCMGTLITELLILTAATCFMNETEGSLTIKTFTSKEFLDVIISDGDEQFLKKHKSLKIVLALKTPINPKLGSFAAKLCDVALDTSAKVELPTYIRWRGSIHTQLTETISLPECRNRLNDPMGKVVIDSMICVKNSKGSGKCQPTQGNPLVHEGKICGINVLGHDCPKSFGVDMYASVYSAEGYVKNRFDAIRKSKIEDAIV